MSTILIVLGVILVLLIVYMMFQDYFTGANKLTGEKHLKEANANIVHNDVAGKNNAIFTYSIWLYVNTYGDEDKIIFKRNKDVALYLDRSSATLKCLVGHENAGVDIYDKTDAIDVTNNFPLQKWVHILVSVDNTIVDIYLDGKLVKSVQISESVSIPEGGADIVFGANWDAYFAKFERYAKATDPKSAYDKYMEGNGGSSLSSALGNMNVNLSITKDNVETSRFALF